MEPPASPIRDRPFAVGWILTISGGLSLLTSAFAVGFLLTAVGLALTAAGILVMGYASYPLATPKRRASHPPHAAAERTSWEVDAADATGVFDVSEPRPVAAEEPPYAPPTPPERPAPVGPSPAIPAWVPTALGATQQAPSSDSAPAEFRSPAPLPDVPNGPVGIAATAPVPDVLPAAVPLDAPPDAAAPFPTLVEPPPAATAHRDASAPLLGGPPAAVPGPTPSEPFPIPSTPEPLRGEGPALAAVAEPPLEFPGPSASADPAASPRGPSPGLPAVEAHAPAERAPAALPLSPPELPPTPPVAPPIWSESPEPALARPASSAALAPPDYSEGDPTPPEGEVLPQGTASSLALLGLPWDSARGPAPAASTPLEAAPASPIGGGGPFGSWSDLPSIVFAPGAHPASTDEASVIPGDPPPSLGARLAARSGAYKFRGAPEDDAADRWLVPGLSVLRPAPSVPSTRGLVTRVPEPPSPGVRGARRCSTCGEPSAAGATGENRCWGCGRPVCSTCFWRYGPGPGIHRCLACAAATAPVSASGGRRRSSATGPWGTAEEPDWGEGI